MREFVEATLSRTQHEAVKLHVTLMNTIFREHLENKDGAERITFDASRIMKVNLTFMYVFNKCHLYFNI